MEIAEAVTTDYLEFPETTRVSKLIGALKEHGGRAILITSDDGVEGVVTRKQLLASRQDPDEKAGNLMRDDVPRIDQRDDVREVARLMVESDLNLLPVYDGEKFLGAITARSLTETVVPYLDALDVNDVYTKDLRSVDPETTLGEVIHTLRVNGISRVPVVDERDDAVGMVSYDDLMDFVVRETDKEQGGAPDGFDGHGGAGSHDGHRSHGGFGERAGYQARLLDLPAENVMNSPVTTTDPTTPLDEAVVEMHDNGYASLVVVVPSDGTDGIVTLTDVLRSLTWTPDEERIPLQVFGIHLLTDLSREDVARMIEEIDDKYEEMDVIEANVILHEHKERVRGTSLIQATIRLFTNKGRFAGTGEEYGAGAAIREARDLLERNVLDRKNYDIDERRSPKSEEDLERLLGWWIEG